MTAQKPIHNYCTCSSSHKTMWLLERALFTSDVTILFYLCTSKGLFDIPRKCYVALALSFYDTMYLIP